MQTHVRMARGLRSWDATEWSLFKVGPKIIETQAVRRRGGGKHQGTTLLAPVRIQSWTFELGLEPNLTLRIRNP